MLNFLEVVLGVVYLKSQNLRKLQWKEKYKYWWKLKNFSFQPNLPLQDFSVCLKIKNHLA
jgi:hypothetical protein